MGIAGASTLPPATPQDARDPDPSSADSLDGKLQLIRQRHTDGAKDPKRFHVSEEEANAYLVYRLAEHLPAEVTYPWVRFGVDQIQGGAMLDASLLGTHLSDSYLAKYLEGQVPVEVLAQVHAEAGVGQVELESVTLSGIPIPRTLVQKLVSDYSKNPSLPNGVRLDDPFPLPYGIVSARFRSGKLILRQGPTQGDDETRSASSAH
jgi:hypothetical protein